MKSLYLSFGLYVYGVWDGMRDTIKGVVRLERKGLRQRLSRQGFIWKMRGRKGDEDL